MNAETSRAAREPDELRLLRARVALRGIVLALEIVAHATLERARDAPRARVRIGDDVPERIAACRELLDERAYASAKHRAKLAPIAAWLERITRAHARFHRMPDRVAASVALLELACAIRTSDEFPI